MSRFLYWTIVLGSEPTSFRAAEAGELLPTLAQLRRKHPEAMLRWFQRGRLWTSPDEAKLALSAERDTTRKRPSTWRPGGTHEDPRQKYIDAKKAKWTRFKSAIRERAESRRERDVTPPPAVRPRDEAPAGERPPRPDWRTRDGGDRPPRPPVDRDRPPAGDRDRKPAFDRDRKPPFDRDRKPAFDRDRKPPFDPARKPPFDRDRKPAFDRDRKPPFDPARKPPFDRDRKPVFDRDRRPPFDPARKPPFDRDRKPAFDRDRRPPFDPARKPPFDRDRKPAFDRDRKPPYDRSAQAGLRSRPQAAVRSQPANRRSIATGRLAIGRRAANGVVRNPKASDAALGRRSSAASLRPARGRSAAARSARVRSARDQAASRRERPARPRWPSRRPGGRPPGPRKPKP